MSEAVAQLHIDLAGDLDRISRRFKKGARFTLIVRQTEVPNADVCIGDDDVELAIAAARALLAEEAKR